MSQNVEPAGQAFPYVAGNLGTPRESLECVDPVYDPPPPDRCHLESRLHWPLVLDSHCPHRVVALAQSAPV